MLSPDKIRIVKPVQFDRRVLNNEVNTSFFVKFLNPVTEQEVELRVSGLWEDAERIYDYGWGKQTSSTLVTRSALVEHENVTDPNTTSWSVYLLRKYSYEYQDQYSKRTDVNYELFRVDLNLDNLTTGENVYNWVTWDTSSKTLAVFEKLFDADLNGDGSVGPVFFESAADPSDAEGLQFIRDTEGATYLYDVNGAHQYFRNSEQKNVWTGNGYEKSVVAVERGDPFSVIAQVVFDAALAAGNARDVAFDMAVKEVTRMAFAITSWWNNTNLLDNTDPNSPRYVWTSEAEFFEAAFRAQNAGILDGSQESFQAYKKIATVTKNVGIDNYSFTFNGEDWSSSVFVVYREGNYNLQQDNVKVFTDQRFSIERLSNDLTSVNESWYDVSVSWFEKYFKQDLNNDGSVNDQGSTLTLVAGDINGLPSDFYVVKDADGRHYLTDNADPDAGSIYRFSDTWFARLNENTANRVAGNAVVTVFNWTSTDPLTNQDITNTYLLTKNFEKYPNQDEKVNSYNLYTLRFNKTDGGKIYSIDLSNNQWIDYNYDKSKLFEIEEKFGRDFNNDNQIGKGDPVVVSWLDSLLPGSESVLPSAVIASNAAGEVFILESQGELAGDVSNYSPIQIVDSNNIAAKWNSVSSWEQKTAYAVVKTTLQSMKDAMGSNTWFPWGSGTNYGSNSVGSSLSMTDTAYFVAVKQVTNGSNVNWQIYLVNQNGVYDNSSLYVSRVSNIETVFGQDLNADSQIGIPTPVDVEGPTKTGAYKSTDSVIAAVDSEGRIFVKDGDLPSSEYMPVLNQWGGDSPQWVRKESWTNWDGSYQYKVERSYDLMGAAKSVDETGKRVYLIAVKETESSTYDKFVGNTRWHVYKVYPKIPVQVESANTDPVYKAAYQAFTDALTAGKTNLEAFDAAAKAAKELVLLEGSSTEAQIDAEIQAARTLFNDGLNSGLSARDAFEKIFADDNNTSTTGSSSTGAGSGYTPGYSPGAGGANTTNLPDNALLFSYQEESLKSITEKEKLFNQDLNGDGSIGLSADSLKLLKSDAAGTRLAREAGGGLYIVEVNSAKAITSFKAITGNDWIENSWYGGADNYNKREAYAVAEIREGLTITGYKLLVRGENKWYGQQTPQVTWDVYKLDKDGKVSYGYWDSTKNMWVNETESGLSSVKSFERTFGQDLDGDGKIGVSIADLKVEARDTQFAKLARDSENALYIVLNEKDFLAIKNASWLEYSYQWGWGGAESKKAIAVQAAEDGSGYWMALERKSQWGGSSTATVSYDILKLDKTGQVTWGYWDNQTNRWVDESQYNLNSLTAYEKIFNEDFNQDGIVGIDPQSLSWDVRDTTGVRLARDKDKAIYIVEVAQDGFTATNAIDIKGANWLEYDSGWGYKREAVAVEKSEDGGYWMALKTTSNYWDYQSGTNKPQISWDIHKLDDKGRVSTGQYNNGQWIDETVYGAKSIAAYEDLFQQDLNDDGIVGVDVDTLQFVETDSKGVRLAKTSDGGLYFVTNYGESNQKINPIKDGWLEYDYSSGDWKNSRNAIAIEQDGDQYILAIKNTNTQWNGTGYELRASWDVMRLSATGKTLYGYWDSNSNRWVEQSEWGASIANYEPIFGEDLNGDGVLGIDISKLTVVSTDTSSENGVRLYRDNDKVLYIVNSGLALPIRNSSWMEYSYAWGDWSNSRTAIAAELLRLDDSGDPIYRVLFKYESKWSGGSDTNWEIITLDSTGRQIWTDSASIWTRNTKIAEIMFNEKLNGDDFIGAAPDDLEDITSDEANPFLRIDKTDKTLYIVERQGDAETKVIPIIDRYGSPVDLSRDVDWGGGTIVKYRPYAVSKIMLDGEFAGYRLLVKVDKTGSSISNWEIYTISKDGAINLFNIKTTKAIARYETEFGQDLDGDKIIGLTAVSLSSESTDTGNAILGRQIVDSEVIALYVQSGGQNILLTNKNGGFPAIETNANGVTSTIVATDVVNLGGGKSAIKVAVKKIITTGAESQTQWDVYHFDVVSNADEPTAVLDRTKTLYYSNDVIKAVEILVDQNLEANDTTVGYPKAAPVAVSVEVGKTLIKDVGDIKAGIDPITKWLYIMTPAENIAVKNAVGLNMTLESSTTYKETVNGFQADVSVVQQVFAATGIYSSSSDATPDAYRVLVRERTLKTWQENGVEKTSEGLRWKLFAVDTNGVIDPDYLETAQPNRWASLFNEEVTDTASATTTTEVQDYGFALTDPLEMENIREIRHVNMDDFYILDSLSATEKYVPILLENQSAIDFDFTTPIGNGQLTSAIKQAAKNQDVANEFFLAVERAYTEGNQTGLSYLVYTLDIKDDPLTGEHFAEVQSEKTYFTDDLSTFKYGEENIFAKVA